jgi:hypothetical protein
MQCQHRSTDTAEGACKRTLPQCNRTLSPMCVCGCVCVCVCVCFRCVCVCESLSLALCLVLVFSFVFARFVACVFVFLGVFCGFGFCCVFLCGFLCFNGFPFAVLKLLEAVQFSHQHSKRTEVPPDHTRNVPKGRPVDMKREAGNAIVTCITL